MEGLGNMWIVMIGSAVLGLIPTAIVLAGGVVAFRRGYMKSGSAIVTSAILSIAVSIGQTVFIRTLGVAEYSLWLGIVGQILGFVSGGLLAGGILGLALSIPVVPWQNDRSE